MASRRRVLVAGVSVRALARSALAAGFDVVTVDGYGDRDLLEPSPGPAAHVTVAPFGPEAAAQASLPPADAVAYGSNLENDPGALLALAAGRPVWGNAPEVCRAVRKFERVQAALAACGLPVARVLTREPDPAELAEGEWLVKPRRSGGGVGVRAWRADEPLRYDEVLQERIAGTPGSLAFLADGQDAAPVALTRQLIGDPIFSASGFRWCGNLLGGAAAPVLPRAAELLASALAAARQLTRAFGLRGLNGIDFIARDSAAVVIEVNPRWTGAMELAERAGAGPLFAAHVAACTGALPALPAAAAGAVHGKAIVFAPQALRMPVTDCWLADPDVRDVPASGSVIPRGAPICTVLADAPTADACHDALAARAAVLVSSCTPAPRAD